jgi:hypothetical protein
MKPKKLAAKKLNGCQLITINTADAIAQIK